MIYLTNYIHIGNNKLRVIRKNKLRQPDSKLLLIRYLQSYFISIIKNIATLKQVLNLSKILSHNKDKKEL